ncbi:chaplin [Streptomyces sp. NRRL S-37]|uniref:chaplin n=1 Tax=Streptomyces sp. NRRL S-37 TaxID=1463903 RepID=UPI00099D167A|nr:chaplin [Streptomyces sp. NRRL S-37]
MTRGVFAAAAATGILSLYGTPAVADSFDTGATEGLSNVLAENKAKAPVTAPVNLCHNTLGAVAAFNETHDNSCGNTSHQDEDRSSGAAHHDSTDHDGENAADSGRRSSGWLSGNKAEVPVTAPVNLCHNALYGVAAFNETHDNSCGNTSHQDEDRSSGATHHDSTGHYGEDAGYGTEGSYGALNGNEVRVPVHVPVNTCDNDIALIALFNDSYGNSCGNYGGYGGYGEEDEPEKETPPPTHVKLPPAHEVEKPPAEESEVPGNPPHLAETGSDGMIAAAAAGAVLITSGAMVYRRSRGRTAFRR